MQKKEKKTYVRGLNTDSLITRRLPTKAATWRRHNGHIVLL